MRPERTFRHATIHAAIFANITASFDHNTLVWPGKNVKTRNAEANGRSITIIRRFRCIRRTFPMCCISTAVIYIEHRLGLMYDIRAEDPKKSHAPLLFREIHSKDKGACRTRNDTCYQIRVTQQRIKFANCIYVYLSYILSTKNSHIRFCRALPKISSNEYYDHAEGRKLWSFV